LKPTQPQDRNKFKKRKTGEQVKKREGKCEEEEGSESNGCEL